jgi:ELWxxDGT repeat protein
MIAAPAGAATDAVLVKDVMPGPGDSQPQPLAEIGGTLFFIADDGTHGRELWKSDGTAVGTRLVADINPGPGDSWNEDDHSWARALNGRLYLAADDGVHGLELWQSDGTASGTRLVADINPGAAGSDGDHPGTSVLFRDRLFFNANDGVHGQEPWMSDGTSTGTRLLRDVIPAPTGPFADGFLKAMAVGDTLFFVAEDPDSGPYSGTFGEQLWKTDGTAAGTVSLAQIGNACCDRETTFLTDFNGLAIVTKRLGCCGHYGFFRSDGTPEGTFYFDRCCNSFNLTKLNGELYFFHHPFEPAEGTAELWRSDASATGTRLVTEITPGEPSDVGGATVVDGTLLFFRYTVWPEPTELSLWASDGTADGTRMITRLGSPGCRRCGVGGRAVVGTRLLVGLSTADLGTELWETDGTEAGTRLVRDINPGAAHSNPQSLTPVGGTLYFTATDGTHGVELWKTTPPIRTAPRRSDYKNAAGYCKAEEEFLGRDAFREKYGTGKNGANAHGKCVKRNG